MSQRQGAGSVREAHRFDEAALRTWMHAHVPDAEGALSVQQFEGGQSNPTFLLSLAAPSGAERRLVLRKKPPGVLLPSAHAVEREYRVLRALSGSAVPVPAALALCEDASVIGTPFYVMEHVDGALHMDVGLPKLEPAARTALYAGLVSTLAAVHRVDYAAIGLSDFGKVGGYLPRQVQRWSQQFDASRTGPSPAMDALIAWLPAHVPADDSTTLTHGDFRVDNLVVSRDPRPRILAVLDWELSTLGHPLADLAHACMPYHLHMPGRGGLLGIDFVATGIPSEAELVSAYCDAVGRAAPTDWPYFLAFVLFRMGSILQGVYKRSLQGNASSGQAAMYGAAVSILAERAAALVGISAG